MAETKELPAFDLKAEREKRKMSQQKCAEFLCQSQGTISRWEITGGTPELARKYWLLYWSVEDDRNKDDAGSTLPRVKKSKGKRSSH